MYSLFGSFKFKNYKFKVKKHTQPYLNKKIELNLILRYSTAFFLLIFKE